MPLNPIFFTAESGLDGAAASDGADVDTVVGRSEADENRDAPSAEELERGSNPPNLRALRLRTDLQEQVSSLQLGAT